MASWLDRVCDRLERDRWVITEDVRYKGWIIPILARYSGFAISRFGYYERFFVFTEFDEADSRDLREFSRDAFICANAKRVCGLPCGIFEAVTCFSVAVVKDLDDRTARSVESNSPPQHWGAFEYPVVYDEREEELLYYRSTPMWGAFYYADMRGDIERYLRPR